MAEMYRIYSTAFYPSVDDAMDLGATTTQFKNLWLDGLAYIDGFGEDTDMGDFDIHSLDGLYGVDDDVFIDLGTDGRIIIQVNGAGTPFSTPDIDITGSVYFDDDIGIALDKKILFGDTGVYIFSDDDGYLDLVADTGIRVSNYVRHTSANYRRYYHMPASALDPGASGATWVDADANTVGGWLLNAVGETLEFNADVHADWDGTDLTVEVYFAVGVAGSADDTIDLKLICYYNAVGDTATKTQTVEVPTTTDGTQYKVYKAIFTINWDETDNVVEAGDLISFILNLETDTSEIDSAIILAAHLHYNTTHTGIEAGDI